MLNIVFIKFCLWATLSTILTLEVTAGRVTHILENNLLESYVADGKESKEEEGDLFQNKLNDVDLKFDYLELDRRFNNAEAEENVIVRTAKQLNPDYTTVQTGVGCGYLRMKPGQVVTIQSSNFKVGEYFNNEACVWRFFGHHCALTAQCPCADIPQSLSCLEDYLKITDTFLFNQRFCGDIKPSGAYQSATNNLKIRFRSDSRETAAGFICYISCAAPGRAQFVVPNNITCPTSSLITTTTSTTTTLQPGR